LVPERDVKTLTSKFMDRLSPDEVEELEELVKMMRKTNPFWAM